MLCTFEEDSSRIQQMLLYSGSVKPVICYMKDVSNILDHFRVSARSVWNTAFWPDPDFRNWDSVEQFDEVRRILFSELVLGKLEKEWPIHDIFIIPIPFLHVMPSSQTIPIMIQNPRSDRSRGYWDHPVNQISKGEAELHFLDFFDWDRMDYLDFHYYRVQIARFNTQPELVGREALIERHSALVLLVDQ
jgi:hypothetical protein